MTFTDILDEIERRHRTIIVYSSRDDPDLLDGFDLRNATVEHRRLPSETPQEFAVIEANDEFVGSIGATELQTILEPPISRPWDESVLTDAYRTLYGLLDNTLFASLERQQLLGATREIENRAWRVGEGTLWVGFQRMSAMQSQVSVYVRLARETDLEIVIAGQDDWEPPPIPGVTYRREPADEIDDFWFIAFDGGGDERQMCALIAEEQSAGEFFGFWTYDPRLVEDIIAVADAKSA